MGRIRDGAIQGHPAPLGGKDEKSTILAERTR